MEKQTEKSAGPQSAGRLGLLDSLRGATLLSMIAYHTAWDAVWLFGCDWPWYKGTGGYVWQQSICWTFILLSGYCWPLGRHAAKRGAGVLGAGALVTAATLLATPESRVVFGVLTFLGSAMLLMIPLERVLRRVPAGVGLAVSAALFAFLRNVNSGCLGFEGVRLAALPAALYRGWLATYLGFPMQGFYSSDYFSLLPWLFLFVCGYFLRRLTAENERVNAALRPAVPGLAWAGRHSLLLYLLHQPVVYSVLTLLFWRR